MQTAPLQLSVRLSVFLASVCAVFLLIGGPAGAERPPGPTVEHVVSPGDTLWAIAAVHADPGDDLRNVVADIRELSGMETSTIYPGQILSIPQG